MYKLIFLQQTLKDTVFEKIFATISFASPPCPVTVNKIVHKNVHNGKYFIKMKTMSLF